jgi:hypothetical protein
LRLLVTIKRDRNSLPEEGRHSRPDLTSSTKKKVTAGLKFDQFGVGDDPSSVPGDGKGLVQVILRADQ